VRSSEHKIGDGAEFYTKYELYFGRNKLSGGTVTEAEWDDFVEEVVSPRFRNGFTFMDVNGQWLDDRTGNIISEKSKLMIIFIKPSSEVESNIEYIRDIYKENYDQSSVMKVDSKVNVSF